MASAASNTPTPYYTKLFNVYYERKAGTERPCYVCRMPTATVLATLNTEDFLYACPKHLTDSGFATAIPDPPVIGPSAADIAKVVEEYKAKEERKQAKEQTQGDDAKEKGKDANKDDSKAKVSATTDSKQLDSPPAPVKAGHRRYALHRALFTMRQRELRMREQAVHAKERSKGLPQVPKGTI